jgi:hypothetical protein
MKNLKKFKLVLCKDFTVSASWRRFFDGEIGCFTGLWVKITGLGAGFTGLGEKITGMAEKFTGLTIFLH